MDLNLGYMDALKQTIDDVDGEAYLRTLYGATVVDEVALGVGVLALPSDIADIMQDARVRAVKAHAGIYSVTSEVDPVTGGNRFIEALVRQLDGIISGEITRDANGAATSASVIFPDGTTGTYTALVVSTAFPGAVDSYSVTYGTQTYIQPTVTRDASGAVINRPAFVVN